MRTREAIVTTATRLFIEQGFEATTVEQIAEETEVSRRTVFRYFANKEMMTFPHQESYLAQFRQWLTESSDQVSPLENALQASRRMAVVFMENRRDHLRQQKIIQSLPALVARGDQLDAEWEEVIRQALIKPGNSSPLARRLAGFQAGAIMGTIRAVLREWYAGQCRQDLVKLGDEAFFLLRGGRRD